MSEKNDYIVCDDHNCELPATHTLVWTKQQYYCRIHADKAIRIASADKAIQVASMLGFPTPSNTVREMTPDEMLYETDADE